MEDKEQVESEKIKQVFEQLMRQQYIVTSTQTISNQIYEYIKQSQQHVFNIANSIQQLFPDQSPLIKLNQSLQHQQSEMQSILDHMLIHLKQQQFLVQKYKAIEKEYNDEFKKQDEQFNHYFVKVRGLATTDSKYQRNQEKYYKTLHSYTEVRDKWSQKIQEMYEERQNDVVNVYKTIGETYYQKIMKVGMNDGNMFQEYMYQVYGQQEKINQKVQQLLAV